MSKYQKPTMLFSWRCKKGLSSLGSFLYKHFLSTLLSIFGLMFFGFCIYISIYIFTNSAFSIQQVNLKFDEVSMKYDNKLTKYLEKDFNRMNKLFYPFYKLKFGSYYTKKYAWIDLMQFELKKNTLDIEIIGKIPELIIKFDTGNYAFVDNLLFPLKPGNIQSYFTLSTGANVESIPSIEVVSAKLSAESDFDALFFAIKPDAFAKQIMFLHQNISDYQSLQYIPGANKVNLFSRGGVEYYFDLGKNMIEQLNKFRLISGSGSLLSSYRKIDIGTMDNTVYLIR